MSDPTIDPCYVVQTLDDYGIWLDHSREFGEYDSALVIWNGHKGKLVRKYRLVERVYRVEQTTLLNEGE